MKLQFPATYTHNSNGYPTLSTTTDLDMTTSTSSDDVDHRFQNDGGPQTESGNNFFNGKSDCDAIPEAPYTY